VDAPQLHAAPCRYSVTHPGVKYRRSEGSTSTPWIIALLAVIVIAVVVWVWWFWGFGSGSGGGRHHHK
jgi:hypothetical protein